LLHCSRSGFGPILTPQRAEAAALFLLKSRNVPVPRQIHRDSSHKFHTRHYSKTHHNMHALTTFALSEAPRIAPPALRGDWKVFDVSAVPIEETDVETGVCMVAWHTVPSLRMSDVT